MEKVEKYTSEWRKILYILFLIGQRSFTILLPILTKYLVDAVTKQDMRQIVYYGVLSILITLLFMICLCTSNYIATCYEEGTMLFMRQDFLHYISSMPYSILRVNGTGYYLQRYQSDISGCRDFLLRKKVNLWLNGIYMGGIIFAMLRINVLYTALMLLPFPLMAIFYRILANKVGTLTDAAESVQDDINSHMEEALNCSYSLRVNNGSNWFGKRADSYFLKRFDAKKAICKTETVYDYALITGLLNLLTSSVYFLGGILVFHSSLTVGMILAMSLYFSKLWTPLEFYMDFPKEFAEYKVHKKRLQEVLGEHTLALRMKGKKIHRTDQTTGKEPIWQGNASDRINISDDNRIEELDTFEQMEVRGLRYSTASKIVFSGLDFVIHRGEKVGITGENGSGKSTFANMLCAIITDYEGEILYNGKSYQKIAEDTIRRHICLLPAAPQLFHGTVLENIILGGKRQISERLVGILENRGLTLGKMIEENASNISSGEAKIIQLIRGIYRDCEIYIFDEPLNFIDKEYADIILEIIEELFTDKTIIMISHDDRPLTLCNLFYQISNGIFKG